jgi:hypothetical protein
MADQNDKPAKGGPMLPKKPPTGFGLFYFEQVDGLFKNGKPVDVIQRTVSCAKAMSVLNSNSSYSAWHLRTQVCKTCCCRTCTLPSQVGR